DVGGPVFSAEVPRPTVRNAVSGPGRAAVRVARGGAAGGARDRARSRLRPLGRGAAVRRADRQRGDLARLCRPAHRSVGRGAGGVRPAASARRLSGARRKRGAPGPQRARARGAADRPADGKSVAAPHLGRARGRSGGRGGDSRLRRPAPLGGSARGAVRRVPGPIPAISPGDMTLGNWLTDPGTQLATSESQSTRYPTGKEPTYQLPSHLKKRSSDLTPSHSPPNSPCLQG